MQTAKRSDRQENVQEEQAAGPERTNQQRLERRVGMYDSTDAREHTQIQHHARRNDGIVHALLAVPRYRPVLDTNFICSQWIVSFTCVAF